MKCNIPEISWHNREPVLSVDIHPVDNDFYKLATGGADSFVLIWQVKVIDKGEVDVDILSELTRHQKAVNAVRWSPNGEQLATADDDANIIVWNLKTDNIPLLEGETGDKEVWIVHKILRGHKEDIYDLCWSPDSNRLVSGSIDNTAIIWDCVKGQNEHIITDHKGFVQGVTWDPKSQFIATSSSDRLCRIFDKNGRRVRARIGRGTLPVSESHELYNKEVKYFHDDTFKTFFRRLSFSPDGSFLVVPAGSVETEDCKKALYATYIFTLDSLTKPAAILPSKQCSIVAKCCPVLFEHWPSDSKPVIDLPYRMIIAVATDSDLVLYDTQQLAPFAFLKRIHYTRLTDLAWSQNGQVLIASSTDGFITLVTFNNGELGVRYEKEVSETEETPAASEIDESTKTSPEKGTTTPVEVKVKKSSFLTEWAKKGDKRKSSTKPEEQKEAIENGKKCKRITPTMVTSEDKKSEPNKAEEIIEILDSPVKKIGKSAEDPKKIVPRKITPITISREVQKSVRKEPELVKEIPNKTVECTTKKLLNNENISSNLKQNTVKVDGNSKQTVKKRIAPIKIGECSKKKLDCDDEHEKDLKYVQNLELAAGEVNSCELNEESIAECEDEVTKIESEIEEEAKVDEPKSKNTPVTKTSATKKRNTPKVQGNEKKQSGLKKKTRKNSSELNEEAIAECQDEVIKIESETEEETRVDEAKSKNTPISKTSATKKRNTPKVQSNEKKQSGSKKKTKPGTPHSSSRMSLLNFFKPIVVEKPKEENDKAITIESDEENIKINTLNLFKKKSNEKTKKTDIDATLNDDTLPEDFCLQIEESMDVDKVKENEACIEEVLHDKNVEQLKNEEVKQPRRIPLITLSSPKNKKKKTDV